MEDKGANFPCLLSYFRIQREGNKTTKESLFKSIVCDLNIPLQAKSAQELKEIGFI